MPHTDDHLADACMVCLLLDLTRRTTRMEHLLMTASENIAADTAAISTAVDTIVAAQGEFDAAIAALKAANPGVDTTALDAVAAKMTDAATALKGDADSNTAPAPVDPPVDPSAPVTA